MFETFCESCADLFIFMRFDRVRTFVFFHTRTTFVKKRFWPFVFLDLRFDFSTFQRIRSFDLSALVRAREMSGPDENPLTAEDTSPSSPRPGAVDPPRGKSGIDASED